MKQVPLASLRVLLTRPLSDGAEEWATVLRAAGAEPIHYPTLTVAAPESWEALDQALVQLPHYDLIIFTSQTTVDSVLARLPGRRFPAELGARIAAVGPATQRAIDKAGARVTLVPSDSRQEGLVELLRPLAQGWRVLLPIAAGGRTLLAENLRSWGCKVDVVTAYRTVPNSELGQPPAFDAAIFASPSALRAYLAVAGRKSLAHKTVAVIGPTTAREAATNGIPAGLAATPDIHALISVIAQTRPNQGDL